MRGTPDMAADVIWLMVLTLLFALPVCTRLWVMANTGPAAFGGARGMDVPIRPSPIKPPTQDGSRWTERCADRTVFFGCSGLSMPALDHHEDK